MRWCLGSSQHHRGGASAASGREYHIRANCAQDGREELQNDRGEDGGSHKLQNRQGPLAGFVLSLVARCGGQEHPVLVYSGARGQPPRRHKRLFGRILTFPAKIKK